MTCPPPICDLQREDYEKEAVPRVRGLRGWVTGGQRSHVEARGHRWSEVTRGGQRSQVVRGHPWRPEVTRGGQRAAALESCRMVLLFALSSFPAFPSSALCPGSLSAPAPAGQSLADVTMSSWGGVSWQVPHLPGAVAGACHSPGPGALVISLLAFSPVKRQVFQVASCASPPQTPDRWCEALRLDYRKDFPLGRCDG